jgi:hypothetical protein
MIINAIEQILYARLFGNSAEEAAHSVFDLGDKNKKHLREVSRRWTAKVQKKVNGWIKISRFHLTTYYTDYYGFGFDNFKVAGSQWVRIGLAGIRFERYPIVFRYIFVIYTIIYRTTIGELSNN